MKKKLLFLLLIIQPLLLFPQNSADIEKSFGSYPGFSDSVQAVVIQPDGKLIIGGSFTSYQGLYSSGIIRLNTNGTRDDSFDVGTEFGNVYSIVLQPDGKLIVAGNFINYKGSVQNRLIRLNPDGSKDNSFDIGTGFNEATECIALQPDGKIIIGGFFDQYQGVSQNYLIRLNADGSKDNSFNIGIGFDNYVKTIVVQADGKILAGGQFYKYKGVIQPAIVRLNPDGTRDTAFLSGTTFNGNIYSIVLQPDNKIIVGGNFTTYKGITQNRLIRLNNDGTKDTNFSIGAGFDNSIYSIRIQSNGKILVGGDFIKYQNATQNRLIRLNSDGGSDTSFDPGTGFNGSINTIVQQTDDQIIIGGFFNTFQDITQNYIVRLNPGGNKDPSLETGTGLSNHVYSINQQNDGKILVGGKFTSYQGTSQNGLIRFETDGTRDNSLDIGLGFDGAVNAVVSQQNGKIVIGGEFKNYKKNSQNGLIMLNSNGSKDFTLDIGTGFNSAVQCINVQTDGKIIVGGLFTTYQGISQNYLIRLNSDGSKDDSFNIGSGFDGSVKVICLQPDGKIIIGGNFTSYQGNVQRNLIRLNSDGSKDKSFEIKSGFNGEIRTIVLQPDGKIIAGGSFYIFQGYGSPRVIRLNTDGSDDHSFDIGSGGLLVGFNDAVSSIILQPNGQIVVGGNFTKFQNIEQSFLIRLNSNGTKDSTFDIQPGFNNNITAIYQQSDNKILVGGFFNNYKATPSSFLIRIKGTETNLSNEDFSTEKSMFSIWPNPVKNTLNIHSLNENNYSVKIYDLSGKLIYSKENLSNSIDVSSFTSGMYLIKIKAENGETSQKFIKI